MRTLVADPGKPLALQEYEKVRVKGLDPSPRDLAAADDIRLSRCVGLRWLTGGILEIAADSYVGDIELDCTSIRIRPKLAGEELGVLHMLDYAAGLNALRASSGTQQLGDGRNLRDLVCQLLISEAERLLNRGLRRDYVRREETLAMLRGRLRLDQQLQRRHGRIDVLECRFDELSTDIPDNQLCAAALALAAYSATDPVTRAKARRLSADYANQCTTADVDARLMARTVTYNRANAHYRAAHQWALLLLQAGGFDRLFAETGDTVRAFLLDMNKLYESFVTKLLQDAARGTAIHVVSQEPVHHAVCKSDGSSYTAIIPDIQLIHGDGPQAKRTSIDAKYKLYADKRIGLADLYQSFAYAQALEATGDHGRAEPDDRPATAYVLYAADSTQPTRSIGLRRKNGTTAAQVTAIAVNLPHILAALRNGTLEPALADLRTQLDVI